MTATVAKKATAAELRANFAHYYCSVHASHGCTQPCDWLAELDVLLAAARAEAVADAGDDAVELREALLSLSARPDDPNRPHINDIIGACIRAARAEAVAPLEARVAELESERGALVEADILRRARVGEVLDVLRQFVEDEKGYEPGNCRWATKAVQSENRRASIMVEIDGRKACLRRWADERRLNYSTVRSRVRRGWDPVAALGGPHGAGEAK